MDESENHKESRKVCRLSQRQHNLTYHILPQWAIGKFDGSPFMASEAVTQYFTAERKGMESNLLLLTYAAEFFSGKAREL